MTVNASAKIINPGQLSKAHLGCNILQLIKWAICLKIQSIVRQQKFYDTIILEVESICKQQFKYGHNDGVSLS